jgi:hypothetical protein
MMIRPPQAMAAAVVAVVAAVAAAASLQAPRFCSCGAAGSTSRAAEHRYRNQIRRGLLTDLDS